MAARRFELREKIRLYKINGQFHHTNKTIDSEHCLSYSPSLREEGLMSNQKNHMRRPHRTVPVVAVVLMALALVLTLLLLFTDIDEPYIGESNAHYGGVLILVPPALFFMAAVAARFDRSVNSQTRIAWTAISAG